MKKLNMFLLAITALSAGCTNEIIDVTTPKTNPDGTRTITVRMVADADTKTTLNSAYTGLVWQEGDQVAYFVNGGTRQIATIDHTTGTFTATVGEGSTIDIDVVYPASIYNEGDTRDTSKEGIPTVQTQSSLEKFNGANLPLTGSETIAATATSVDVAYSVANAAILGFKFDGATGKDEVVEALWVKTTDGGKMLSAGGSHVKVTLPTGTKVSDLQDKTIWAVVAAGDYDVVELSLTTTATKTYVLDTDITSKGDRTGFAASGVNTYKWNLASTTTHAIEGLMIKLGNGAWQTWDGTQTTLQAMDDGAIASKKNAGSTATPYSIKIATGGTTTFSKDNMTALVGAINGLNSASSIALDMSAVKMEAVTSVSNQPLRSAFRNDYNGVQQLRSFVFPTDGTNITSISYTFCRCSNLTSVSAIPAGVTNMEGTFSGCTQLNQPITIPAGVTNMGSTFNGCTQFNQAITIPAGVTKMETTFAGCTALGADFAKTVTINIATNKIITSSRSAGNYIAIYNMFGSTTVTANIDLRVPRDYLGDGGNVWYYPTDGTAPPTDCYWEFKSVEAIGE